MMRVLPIRRVRLVGRDGARTRQRASDIEAQLGLETAPFTKVGEALRGADVLVTCTPARAPMVELEDVSPGMFIAAVGADSPGKQELSAELVAHCTAVADVRSQCVRVGELQHPIRAGLMSEDIVHAEIGNILSGAKPGRTRDDEITLYDSTGTALQDVAVGFRVYEEAQRRNLGQVVQFGD